MEDQPPFLVVLIVKVVPLLFPHFHIIYQLRLVLPFEVCLSVILVCIVPSYYILKFVWAAHLLAHIFGEGFILGGSFSSISHISPDVVRKGPILVVSSVFS